MAIDLESDRWRTYSKHGSQRRASPRLSVYADGKAHLNARATNALDADEVVFKTDPATGEFVIVDVTVDPHHTEGEGYAVARQKPDQGGDLHTIGALRDDLGVDIEAIDETQFFDLDVHDGYAVADLSGLPGVGSDATETSDASDSDATDDTTDPLVDVPGVGSTKATALREAGYDSVDALQAASQEELSNVDSIGNALAARVKADVGTEIDPSPKVVRDAAETVDALSELAAKLDVTSPQAYTLARDAGVLDGLEDDRKRPMGSPQEGDD